MEFVSFSYYSYIPRLRLNVRIEMENVPAVGDVIRVPIAWFSEVGKPFKSKIEFNRFIVMEREYRFEGHGYYWGKGWCITLDTHTDFLNLDL